MQKGHKTLKLAKPKETHNQGNPSKIPIKKTTIKSLKTFPNNQKNAKYSRSPQQKSTFINKDCKVKPNSALPNPSQNNENQKQLEQNERKESNALMDIQKNLETNISVDKDFIKVFIRFRPMNDLENGLLSDKCGWEVPN